MAAIHRPAPDPGARDRVVVVTGAAGNLGRKLCAYLRERDGYELRAIDLVQRGTSAITVADLGRYDEQWTSQFDGADVLVHLAADHLAGSGWDTLTPSNVDALLNVYLAAARHKVGKVVLASSMWAVAARWRDQPPIAACEPDPGTNAYGATKLFGERAAKAFAAAHGIDSIALRIGTCFRGANLPMRLYPPDDALWISDRDMCRGIEAAIRADVRGFVVVNLTSANPARRWSLDEARETIGYVPLDGYAAPRTPFTLSPRNWLRGTHVRDRLRAAWRAWRQPH